MKRLKHFLEYATLRTVEFVLCALPLRLALELGEQLGTLMSGMLPKRRRLIIENLTRAFPEKSPAEVRKTARRNWKNLGRTALEFVRSQDFVSSETASRVTWEGADQVDAAMAENHGMILISFHFTNWEILGILTQQRFNRLMAIARPMKNPYVDRWLQAKRAQDGMKIMLHRNAVKESLRWLKGNNMLGVLVDQNLYHGGVFVNFFGRPAATTTLPALLHIRTGAPVFVVHCLRESGTFRATYEQVEFPRVDNDDQRVIVYTQIINDYLERIIRKYPENWFWIHNRWKRKPDPAPTA